MTEFWRACQSYEHCPQSYEQPPNGSVITLAWQVQAYSALNRRGSELL
jgi:hypothetical protein